MTPYEHDMEVCHFCIQITENETDRETLQLHAEYDTFTRALQSHEEQRLNQGSSIEIAESEVDAELKRLEQEFNTELEERRRNRSEKHEVVRYFAAELSTEDTYAGESFSQTSD